jgi:hypothetical protein
LGLASKQHDQTLRVIFVLPSSPSESKLSSELRRRKKSTSFYKLKRDYLQ